MESYRVWVILFAFLFFATCRSLSSPTLGPGRDAGFGFSIRIPSGLPGGLASTCHAGATGSISGGRFEPWVREIPWRRAWQPTQYSCLENPMDRGAWGATVHRVAKSRTRRKRCSVHTHTHAHTRTHPASLCRPQFPLALFHLHPSFLSEGQPHSLQALALEVNASHRLFNQLPQFHEVQLLWKIPSYIHHSYWLRFSD